MNGERRRPPYPEGRYERELLTRNGLGLIQGRAKA